MYNLSTICVQRVAAQRVVQVQVLYKIFTRFVQVLYMVVNGLCKVPTRSVRGLYTKCRILYGKIHLALLAPYL